MSNSIVDDDDAQWFAPNFGNFDDSSMSVSEREDFLLVLSSSLSGSTAQNRNQKRALTILEACGVQPEVLDAAEPGNALVRDELCEMSGIRGVYPQFFLVQGDRTTFFADFAELEHMNEEGMLAEWLSVELPIAKLPFKNNESDDNIFRKTPAKDNPSDTSEISCAQDDGNINIGVVQSNHEYATSSSTEDLLNVEDVSEILNSLDKNKLVPSQQQQRQHQEGHGAESNNKSDSVNKNVILSKPSTSTTHSEWSDPLSLKRYEEEVVDLENYLQEQEAEGGDQQQQQQGVQSRSIEQRGEIKPGKLKERVERYELGSAARIRKTPDAQSPLSSPSNNDGSNRKQKGHDTKDQKQSGSSDKKQCDSLCSLSSTATTVTISPTSSSSSSRSPGRHRAGKNSAINNSPSTLPSPPPLLSRQTKSDEEESLRDESMRTVSARSESQRLLQAEVEELRSKCEKLTAERYILEGQLKEARQRNKHDEQRSSDRQNTGTVDKAQLQQALRCASCTKGFKSNSSSLQAPIASQSCGHSICRNCCQKRLSEARRHEEMNTIYSSERLKNTISSDLFMCGMGDMSKIYSPSFDENQRQLQECESCPICCAPKAFRHGKLCVNETLCNVLKLLDDQPENSFKC